jgi:hypothetical protein
MTNAQNLPAVTFGMIVLNGQPFLRYNLRALYPFASQIVVVEGAVEAAADSADAAGHSLDGTLQELYRFKAEEDPEDKLEIVTRDGYWTEKDEQSQAYATRARGDYLWQVDVDELYQPQDMMTVFRMLGDDPSITAVSFPHLLFWASTAYIVNGWYLMREQANIRRVFKWGHGYQYAAHRPPQVLDNSGRDVFMINPAGGADFRRAGIFMYHYSLLFPQQVRRKSRYYQAASWSPLDGAEAWAERTFMDLQSPYRVHNSYQYPSWLERAPVASPPQVQALMAATAGGDEPVTLRQTSDIEALLNNPWYARGASLLRAVEPAARAAILARRRMRRWLGSM